MYQFITKNHRLFHLSCERKICPTIKMPQSNNSIRSVYETVSLRMRSSRAHFL